MLQRINGDSGATGGTTKINFFSTKTPLKNRGEEIINAETLNPDNLILKITPDFEAAHSLNQVYEIEYLNGDKYCGKLDAAGLKSGHGSYSWSDGSCYTGDWENDLQNGKGLLSDKFGEFNGLWYNGVPHGKGEFTNKHKVTVHSTWNLGELRTQNIIIKYPNASEYRGDVFWDTTNNVLLYHGKGTLVLTDKSQYCGEFKNGLQHGSGSITTKAGDNYKGYWSEGVFDHEKNVEVKYKDGDRYAGLFNELSLRHGQGTYFNAKNQVSYTGNWNNDVMDGEFTITDKNGVFICKRTWANGKLVTETAKE